MPNDTMFGSLYLLIALVLVVSGLMSRREPAAKLVKMAAAWIVIFAAGFVLFTFRDDFGYLFQRLKAEAVGSPVSLGAEIRVPMAADGHFWVDAKVNGHDVRFLVDSGATMTTIDRNTAVASGVSISGKADQSVRTGNGVIRVYSGRADKLAIASIERRGVGLQIVDGDDLNVLGMNYLSTLTRWGVEGRWLVLAP